MESGGQGARWDGRAQAIQLGALLLFAILIINLSLFQVFVVPNQNSEIEFKHNQQVQEELKTARSLAQQAAVTDSELSTSVRLAPQYPSRTLFVNPAPPAGTLETVDRSDLVVSNAEPLDAEARQAWDTSGETFATKALVFRPGYNYYSNAPTTVYGESVLYNIQSDGATVRNRTGQSLVSGNRITLVTMTGAVSTSATGGETVEFQPTSAPTQRVPVRASGGDLTIQVKTRIPEDVWENDLLAGQIDDPTVDENGDGDNDEPGRYVTDVTMVSGSPPSSVGTLEITFESGPDKTYSLRLGQVGVGDNVDDETASYITKVDPTADSLSVVENEEREIVVEVRDRYNNPVSGVTVNVDDPPGAGTVTATEDTTDERGRASFVYKGSSTGGPEDLDFSIPDDSFQGSGSTSGLDDAERVEYTATVNPAPGSGSGSGGGGGADYDLVWESPATTPGSAGVTDCSAIPCAGLPLAVTTSPSTDGAPVYFGSSDTDVATLSEGDPTRTDGGRARTRLNRKAPGETTLQTFSGGNRDTLGMKVHLRDGFEDGNLGEEWTTIDGNDQVSIVSSPTNGGSNAAEIGDVGENGGDAGGGILLDGSVDTDGADLIVLEYWAQEGSGFDTPEGSESLRVQYRDDAGNWNTIEDLSVVAGSNAEYNRRVNITASDAMHPNFAIRFNQRPTTAEDPWYVDDVALSVYGPSGSTAADLGGNTLDDSGDGGGNGGGGSTPSADSVEYVSNSGQVGSNDDEIRFEIENTGGSNVIVTDFSVDYDGTNKIQGSGEEVIIDGSTQRGDADRSQGYPLDGTSYSLDTNAVISSGDTVTVTLANFKNTEFDSVSDGDMISNDMTVTLTFADESTETIYFDVSTD